MKRITIPAIVLGTVGVIILAIAGYVFHDTEKTKAQVAASEARRAAIAPQVEAAQAAVEAEERARSTSPSAPVAAAPEMSDSEQSATAAAIMALSVCLKRGGTDPDEISEAIDEEFSKKSLPKSLLVNPFVIDAANKAIDKYGCTKIINQAAGR